MKQYIKTSGHRTEQRQSCLVLCTTRDVLLPNHFAFRLIVFASTPSFRSIPMGSVKRIHNTKPAYVECNRKEQREHRFDTDCLREFPPDRKKPFKISIVFEKHSQSVHCCTEKCPEGDRMRTFNTVMFCPFKKKEEVFTGFSWPIL